MVAAARFESLEKARWAQLEAELVVRQPALPDKRYRVVYMIGRGASNPTA
jgi:hypothetical protein